MIPTPEQLSAISQMTQGNLQQVPVAPLLFSIAVHGRTALVELRRNQIEKRIVFADGVPVDCRSNMAHETLGRYMVELGHLTDEQFTASLAKAASRGVPLGEVLIEQELIGAYELYRVLQQNLAKKLLDCFTWHEGTFDLSPNPPNVDSTLKVKPAQLIVTGISKFASQEEVDRSIVPLIGKALILHPSPPFSLDEVRLPAPQTKLINSIAGEFRIDEIAASGEVAYEDVTRMLYALAVIGVVVRADQVPAQVRKEALLLPPRSQRQAAVVASVQAPAPLTAAAPEAPDRSQLQNEIMQEYLSFRRHDAFELLKLDETAGAAEIEEKYLLYAERFRPSRLSVPGLEALEEKSRELFLAGARAYAELIDTERRMSLIHRRKTLREEQRRAQTANQFVIKTDLLDPEMQFRKGKALMDAGRYREAIGLLEFASDCDAQNAMYRSELAWCRFLESPHVASQSIKDLRETMRIDPQCGVAFYYAGEILRQRGDRAESEPLLRKACKLMAPDRRPVEALKALVTGA